MTRLRPTLLLNACAAIGGVSGSLIVARLTGVLPAVVSAIVASSYLCVIGNQRRAVAIVAPLFPIVLVSLYLSQRRVDADLLWRFVALGEASLVASPMHRYYVILIVPIWVFLPSLGPMEILRDLQRYGVWRFSWIRRPAIFVADFLQVAVISKHISRLVLDGLATRYIRIRSIFGLLFYWRLWIPRVVENIFAVALQRMEYLTVTRIELDVWRTEEVRGVSKIEIGACVTTAAVLLCSWI